MEVEPKDPASSLLTRINARAWGIATGLLFGLGLFIATVVLVIKGGADVGAHLGRLGHVLPGYDVSVKGAFIGLIYGFVIGYALGRFIGPRRPIAEDGTLGDETVHMRLNGRAWSIAIGMLLAIGLFAATNALALQDSPNKGDLLNHLHLYFPGYSVDFRGSLIGFAYALALGWAIGQVIALVYNRAVARAEA
jgi:hypothetical protein